MTPRVSVLLPVRDAGATLDECLASLRAQTLVDHEVIAVDDGSTDGSRERSGRAARADERVRVLSGPARGLVAALNHGLARGARAAAGAHGRRRRGPSRAARSQARASGSGARADGLGSRRASSSARWPGQRRHARLRRLAELAAGPRRDRARAVRGVAAGAPQRDDADGDAARARRLPGVRRPRGLRPVAARRAAAGSASRSCPRCCSTGATRPTASREPIPATTRTASARPKIGALEAGPLRGGRPVVVWGAGPIGKAWSRDLRRGGHRVAAFVEVDPDKIGQRIHGAPVVAVRRSAGLEAGSSPRRRRQQRRPRADPRGSRAPGPRRGPRLRRRRVSCRSSLTAPSVVGAPAIIAGDHGCRLLPLPPPLRHRSPPRSGLWAAAPARGAIRSTTLVETVLSQNTSDLNSGRAFASLKADVPELVCRRRRARAADRAGHPSGRARTDQEPDASSICWRR